MAPSGRARKRSRIDAALHALRPLGFNDVAVRSTLQNLLTVYGGEDGWAFIQEDYYKLLIDTILEDEDKYRRENAESKSSLEGNSPKKDNTLLEDKPGVEAHSPPVHFLQVGLADVNVPLPLDIQCSQENLALQVHLSNTSAQQDLSQQSTSGVQNTISNSLNENTLQDNLGVAICSPQIYSTESTSPLASSTALVELPPARKRKPCYGWISDDEEDMVHPNPTS